MISYSVIDGFCWNWSESLGKTCDLCLIWVQSSGNHMPVKFHHVTTVLSSTSKLWFNETFSISSFDDACLAIEVLWSSLPPPHQSLLSLANGGGVQLYEQRFRKPEESTVKEGSMGNIDICNISSTTTKSKLQHCTSQTGYCVQGGRIGKSVNIIKSVH